MIVSKPSIEVAEVPLSGGRTTPGVVRVGDTVRRPQTANSTFVRRLLRHLADKRFGASPAFLGIDEFGRDILSFIEGDVPADLACHDDGALWTAASMIRRFHDIGAEMVPTLSHRRSGIETICHNDLSPCNFVFRDGTPIAIIDFDAAAAGPRLLDLGYAAWLWLDLGCLEIPVPDQRRRLANFVKAYGMYDVEAIFPAILERQAMLSAEGRRTGKSAMADWADHCREWTQSSLAP